MLYVFSLAILGCLCGAVRALLQRGALPAAPLLLLPVRGEMKILVRGQQAARCPMENIPKFGEARPINTPCL